MIEGSNTVPVAVSSPDGVSSANTDVLLALEILRQLGARVDFDIATETAVIDATSVNSTEIPPDIAMRMRASLLFVGPLLSR